MQFKSQIIIVLLHFSFSSSSHFSQFSPPFSLWFPSPFPSISFYVFSSFPLPFLSITSFLFLQFLLHLLYFFSSIFLYISSFSIFLQFLSPFFSISSYFFSFLYLLSLLLVFIPVFPLIRKQFLINSYLIFQSHTEREKKKALRSNPFLRVKYTTQ